MTTTKKKCALPECDREFETDKFHPHRTCCSRAHQTTLLRRTKKGTLQGVTSPVVPIAKVMEEKPRTIKVAEEKPRQSFQMPRMMNTDVQTQVAISLMDKEIDRVTADYKAEKERRKKVEELNEKLREELASLKTDSRIAEIEKRSEQNAKPTGLGALMESPLIADLMPHIGPAIGKLLEGLMSPGTPTMTGLPEGQQPEPGAQQFVNELLVWAGAQPVEVQNKFVEMVGAFGKMTPQQTLEKLTLIVNLLGAGARPVVMAKASVYGS